MNVARDVGETKGRHRKDVGRRWRDINGTLTTHWRASSGREGTELTGRFGGVPGGESVHGLASGAYQEPWAT